MFTRKTQVIILLATVIVVVFIAIIAIFTINHSSEDITSKQIRHVVVEVDPGIDDIEALVFLINADNRKEIKLEAIVITEGNTDYTHGIRNVYLLLLATNRKDIPVYLGATRAFLQHTTHLDNWFGVDGLGNVSWHSHIPIQLLQKDQAFGAVASLVRKYPNEIIYIALSPAISLATTILLYPDVGEGLKEVHVMVGFRTNDHVEFNAKFDPEAVDIVLRGIKSKLVFLTFEAGTTNAPAVNWYKNVSIVNPVWDFIVRINDGYVKIQYGNYANASLAPLDHCDPIVPAYILNPSIIRKIFTSPLEVEVGRGPMRGLITNSTSMSSISVEVILEIDFDIMLADFIQTCTQVCENEFIKCQAVF